MNLRQPYEQLIADKLRQLRPPDADRSWQQMKRLLDDDDDEGTGGSKRPPRNNGWWRIGIIVIVLSASAWLYVDSNRAPRTSLAVNNTAASTRADDKTGEAVHTKNSDKTKTAIIDNKTTLTNQNTNTNSVTGKESSTTAGKSTATAIKNNATTAVTTLPDNDQGATANKQPSTITSSAANASLFVKKNTIKRAAGNTQANAINNHLPADQQEMTELTINNNRKKFGSVTGDNAISGTTLSFKQNDGSKIKRPSAGKYISNDESANSTTGNIDADHPGTGTFAPGLGIHKVKQAAGKVNNKHISGDDKTFITATDDDDSRTTGNNYNPVNQSVSSKEKTWFERLTGLKMSTPDPSFSIAVTAGDSIATSRDVSNLLNAETKKAIAKAQRDKAIELLDRKDKKSLHLNLSNVFKPFSMRVDVEPWWAAGLAINGGVTVNAQSRYNYNVNGKSNTLTDYIPSPYLQYHLNNYVYLQTELNFITPQYTPQLLVYRQNNEVTATGGGTGGISQQKSIYIQKLYYFNWPVSLHYSPVSNLYFSAGIQFSSFQSGLAAIESKQYTTALGPDRSSSATTTVLKFKDDSIAAKIAPNEWRWQVGAEYYWNRFSVGLRYNQSLKKAINATVSSSLPPTVNRNESMLFFVRYNLFESRKK